LGKEDPTQKNKKMEGIEKTYRKFLIKGRREVNVESHGTTQCGTEVLVSLVVPSKHFGAADLCWLRLHLSLSLSLSLSACSSSPPITTSNQSNDSWENYGQVPPKQAVN